VTRYQVVEARRFFSVVHVYPLTGRTNQIRIQFSQAGFPLVGERKYAFARDYSLKFRRVALHASELQWRDPLDRRMIKVISPVPEDMKAFLSSHQI